MVVTTMERHCGLMQSRKLLNQLEGPTGIVQSMTSVNKKLPTITPLLVPSNTVEDNGKVKYTHTMHPSFDPHLLDRQAFDALTWTDLPLPAFILSHITE